MPPNLAEATGSMRRGAPECVRVTAKGEGNCFLPSQNVCSLISIAIFCMYFLQGMDPPL